MKIFKTRLNKLNLFDGKLNYCKMTIYYSTLEKHTHRIVECTNTALSLWTSYIAAHELIDF